MTRIALLLAVLSIATGAGAASQQAKLERIVLPEVDFRQAKLRDVMEYLVQQSRELDVDSEEGAEGVNIVLNVPPGQEARTVTFKGRNVTLGQVLKAVTRIAGVPYTFMGNVIMVGQGVRPAEKTVKAYTVPLALSGEMRKEGAAAYLRQLGIPVSESMSARYVPAARRLVVTASPAAFSRLDPVLRRLGILPATPLRR
jgi:hypothetical protein